MKEEVVIPAGALALALDAALALVLADQRQGDAAQPPQVIRRVARPRPALVLPEDNIQHPVQAVLDPPVPADRLGSRAGPRPPGPGAEPRRPVPVPTGRAGAYYSVDRNPSKSGLAHTTQ